MIHHERRDNMLSIALCDDEKQVCDYLDKRCRRYLAEIDEEVNISAFSGGEALEEACRKNPNGFDIIFLDIKMQGSNGVDSAKALREIGVNSLIVFVTSSAEYVFSGYEVKAFRYILKTELENAFDRIFGECLKELRSDEENVYSLKIGSGVKTFRFADILYWESDKRKIILHTKNECVEYYGKLDDAEKELEEKDFIRAHQSFLVNAQKIAEIQKTELVLSNGEVLPISKSRRDKIKEAYLWAKR